MYSLIDVIITQSFNGTVCATSVKFKLVSRQEMYINYTPAKNDHVRIRHNRAKCQQDRTQIDHEPAYIPPSRGFYHMVISGYLDHQSTQFRLSASELLLFVSVIAMTLSLSNSFIMTKKAISI